MAKDKIEYTRGSGNVFADMGLPNPEERLVKSKLARLVNEAIENKGWTQKYTAEVLGITQPNVSDMSRGRLKHFSVERLMEFLAKLDHNVTITVQDKEEILPPHEIEIVAKELEKGVHAST